MFRIFMFFQIILAFKTWTEVLGANHRCFVCIPSTGSSVSDVLQMYPRGTVIPLCSQFHIDKPEYVRECPSPKHQGCLTQTNGTFVTKTCTDFGIEDCKTANKIRYCYCKDELCNRESVPTEIPIPPLMTEADDDEDSPSEGSGSAEEYDSRHSETFTERVHPAGVTYTHSTTTTTLKSVILTTAHPKIMVPVKASSNRSAQPMTFACFIPFLLFFFFFYRILNYYYY